MKAVRHAWKVACLVTAWLGASCIGTGHHYEKAGSPEALLRAILAYSEEGNYEAIASLVYPLQLPFGGTVPDYVVAGMRAAHPTSYVGDFSYSDEALRVLLQRHVSELRCPSEDEMRSMGVAKGRLLMDESLLALTNADPRNFLMFSRGPCRVVLLNKDGDCRLVFWEGLNSLL